MRLNCRREAVVNVAHSGHVAILLCHEHAVAYRKEIAEGKKEGLIR